MTHQTKTHTTRADGVIRAAQGTTTTPPADGGEIDRHTGTRPSLKSTRRRNDARRRAANRVRGTVARSIEAIALSEPGELHSQLAAAGLL